jgi:hypothetical protein
MSGTGLSVLAAAQVVVLGGFILVTIVLPAAVDTGVVQLGDSVAMCPAISSAIWHWAGVVAPPGGLVTVIVVAVAGCVVVVAAVVPRAVFLAMRFRCPWL